RALPSQIEMAAFFVRFRTARVSEMVREEYDKDSKAFLLTLLDAGMAIKTEDTFLDLIRWVTQHGAVDLLNRILLLVRSPNFTFEPPQIQSPTEVKIKEAQLKICQLQDILKHVSHQLEEAKRREE